ncbi:MAG: hypothetical protein HKN37_00505 [Rhodothermales bacterium]|nr:hypothetical protein [Rhodothermales bacterium]
MRNTLLIAVALAAVGFAGFSAAKFRTNPDSGGDNTLISVGPMHTPRAVHTSTLLADGSVLITGGFAQDRESDPFATVEIFDAERNAFKSGGKMTMGRQSHSASVLPVGTVLIVGGYGAGAMSTSEIYDPGTNASEPAAKPVTGRAAHRATELLDGRILITGGNGEAGSVLSSVEAYDPTAGEFRQVGSLTSPRVGHTQTLLDGGSVLIVGGTSGWRNATKILATAEVFDPAKNTSVSVGEMNTPRYKHAAVRLADGRVLVVGGSNENDFRGRYDTAEIYDPSTRTFTETNRLKSARFKLRTAVARLADGLVLIAGGSDVIEIFDPRSQVFEALPDRFDTARFFASATALPDGRALITGGYDQRIQSTSKAWLYMP